MYDYCWNCGNQIKPGQKFCARCGAKLPGEESEEKHMDKAATGKEKLTGMNIFSFFLIVVCVIIWFCTPLATIEHLETNPHPSGFMLLESFDKELIICIRSFTFWLEILALLGILVGLIASVFRNRRASRDYALISAFCQLFIIVFDLFRLGGNIGRLPSDFGWGFWMLLGLLVFTAIVNIFLERRASHEFR